MKREKKRSAGFYAGFILFVLVALVNVYPMVFSIFCSFKGNLRFSLPLHPFPRNCELKIMQLHGILEISADTF